MANMIWKRLVQMWQAGPARQRLSPTKFPTNSKLTSQSSHPQPQETMLDGRGIGWGMNGTFTEEFYWNVLAEQLVNFDAIYGLLAEDISSKAKQVDDFDCAEVDCLNPCYDNGACYRCVEAAMESGGWRLPICD